MQKEAIRTSRISNLFCTFAAEFQTGSAALISAEAVRTLKVWFYICAVGKKNEKTQNKFGYIKSFLYLCRELSVDSSVATLQQHIYYY